MKRKLKCKRDKKRLQKDLSWNSDGKWSFISKNDQITYLTILQVEENFLCFTFIFMS